MNANANKAPFKRSAPREELITRTAAAAAEATEAAAAKQAAAERSL